MLSPQGGVGRLPPSPGVVHAHEVGHQHVVMGAGIAGPGGGVPGRGVGEPFGGGAHRRPAPPSAHAAGDVVEVGQGGVTLGVHDGVHVLGPADDAKLGDGLVGGDHQLHARAGGTDQPVPGGRVTGPAGTEQSLVLVLGHGALEAQGIRSPAAPDQRRLAPGGVVGQRLTGMVVAPGQHGGAVVGDRVGAHHPHPRHRRQPP